MTSKEIKLLNVKLKMDHGIKERQLITMMMDLFLQELNLKKENKFEKYFVLFLKSNIDLAVNIKDFASNIINWNTFDDYKIKKVVYM